MNNVPPQFNNNPNQNQSSDQGFSQNNQGYYQNQNCNQGFNQGCNQGYNQNYNQGYNQNYNQGYNQGGNPNFNSWYCNDAFSTSPVTGKSRGVAALLAILLGTLGIHYFYCGKTGAGIGFLLVSLLSCGILGAVTAILALISGIKMFCMTNEQFDQTYVLTTSSMPI